MVDLNMPEGLSYEERRQWLRETGAAMAAETGEPSGQVDFVNAEGQDSWVMWWTEEEYHGPYETTDGEHQDSTSEQPESPQGDGTLPKPTADS